MKLKKILIGLLCGSLLITACSKKEDSSDSKVTPDSERSISEPRFGFVPDSQDLKLANLNSSERSALSACDQKSTASRTEKKKYSVGSGLITRALQQGLKSIRSDYFDYKTDTKGETYELTTSLLEFVIEDQSVLTNGGITYIDSCSVSKGCDPEKRRFTKGSVKYLIATNAKEVAVQNEIRRNDKKTECQLKESTEELSQVQKGFIKIGEYTYPAVQILKKLTGKIYCSSGDENLFLGMGSETGKIIMLQDQLTLPEDNKLLKSLNGMDNFSGCERTVVFASMELQADGTTVSGASQELVDYTLNAEVKSLEDWKQNQKEFNQKVSKMRDEIDVNKASLERAKLSVSRAEADLKSVETKLAELKVKLNEAIINKLPTEVSLRGLVSDAEKSVELARKNLDSSNNLVVIEQNKLKASEEALAAYIRENGNNQ